MCGSSRVAMLTVESSRSWTSLGMIPGRSRARRSTASGSRIGTIATFITTLLGTMMLSLPTVSVVHSRPIDDTLALADDPGALEPHPFADLERPRADAARSRR